MVQRNHQTQYPHTLNHERPKFCALWQHPDSVFVVMRDQDAGDCRVIKICKERIDAVEKALEKALGEDVTTV